MSAPFYVQRNIRAVFIPHDGRAKLIFRTDEELMEPAFDGVTWPCGHPKTVINSQSVGDAGYRCRLCRRAIGRKCANKVRGKA